MLSKPKIAVSTSAKNSPPGDRQTKIEKRRRFWRKARRRLFWTLAILIVAHTSLNIYASVLLNRELAAIREKGDPLRFSEIEPPAVPPAHNAALVYEQATKSLHFSPDQKHALEVRARRSVMTPQIEKSIESALRNNQKALDLARRASSMPECRFPLDWKGNPTRFRFPYYADLRQLARLLATNARVQAQKGNGSGAIRDVRALFGMSHHLSKEPYLIGFLVAQSVDIMAHRALGQTLQSVPLTLAQGRALEASLPEDNWTRSFRHSLVGERMMGIFAFENIISAAPVVAEIIAGDDDENEDSVPPAWLTAPLVWIWRPVLKLDEVQTLRLWRQLLDSPQSQHVPRPIAFSRAQDAAIQNLPFYAALTKILLPAFTRASDTRDFAEVRRREREVALALTGFRTARGHYPATLQEAATFWEKPLPLDPYSQKPFVYHPGGKEFLLYSVGVNRVDDGGTGARSEGKHFNLNADDLVWGSS